MFVRNSLLPDKISDHSVLKCFTRKDKIVESVPSEIAFMSLKSGQKVFARNL